jgi:uncharacterized protein YxjI
MIFCKKCGRYYTNGTSSCGTCGANLDASGHVTLSASAVKLEPIKTERFEAPAQTLARISTPKPPDTSLAASPASGLALASSSSVAVLDTPIEQEVREEPPEAVFDPVFDRDKFLLRQKAFAIKEKYYVTDDNGSAIAYVERPALIMQQLMMLAGVAVTFVGGSAFMAFISGFVGTTLGQSFSGVFSVLGFLTVLGMTAFVFVLLVPKRHITFYKDDTRMEKLLEIKQLNKVEFPYANFSVLDRNGILIGSLRKNVLFDYIRRRWQVNDSGGQQICMAKEDSIILSLLRRTGIPIFLFLRTNFIFLRGEQVIGEFNRKLTLLDRYVLDLTADRQRFFNRRLALALGVMLDTGERR